MASRRIYKKEISALCGLLMEDLIIYHIVTEKPETETANALFEKAQELAIEYRAKAASGKIRKAEQTANKYFTTVWADFTKDYEQLFEEIINFAKID